MISHYNLVHRMTFGGFSVLGIYVFAKPAELTRLQSSGDLVDVLRASTPDSMPNPDKLLLGCPMASKLTCSLVATGSKPRTVQTKTQRVVASLVPFACSYALDVSLPVSHGDLETQLLEGLQPVLSNVINAKVHARSCLNVSARW